MQETTTRLRYQIPRRGMSMSWTLSLGSSRNISMRITFGARCRDDWIQDERCGESDYWWGMIWSWSFGVRRLRFDGGMDHVIEFGKVVNERRLSSILRRVAHLTYHFTRISSRLPEFSPNLSHAELNYSWSSPSSSTMLVRYNSRSSWLTSRLFSNETPIDQSNDVSWFDTPLHSIQVSAISLICGSFWERDFDHLGLDHLLWVLRPLRFGCSTAAGEERTTEDKEG